MHCTGSSDRWRAITVGVLAIMTASCDRLIRGLGENVAKKALTDAPRLLCQNETLARCMTITNDACLAVAKPHIVACVEESRHEIDGLINKAQAQEWARRVGKCSMKRVVHAMSRQGKLKPECGLN